MKNKFFAASFALLLMLALSSAVAMAGAVPGPSVPSVSFQINGASDAKELGSSIELVLVFTILTLLPSILMMMTSFTRILIVLSFLKSAMGAQQTLPSQMILGLTIFLTMFIMAPVGNRVYQDALGPYFENRISQNQAIERAMGPVREFMFKQTRESDVKLFMDLSKDEKLKKPESITLEDIPNTVLIPSFMISELKTGFQIGFLLFIPFIIIDMVVSSTLMSMGMMMLPPMMISLPFKILLFILADGWGLVIRSLVSSFK